MNYDEYVEIINYVLNDKHLSVKKLADSLDKTDLNINQQIHKLASQGGLLKINSDQILTFTELPDIYRHQLILSKIITSDASSYVELDIFLSLDSTNSYLKSVLNPGSGMSICLAETQTNGRGRRGKSWESPFGANVYLSIRKKIYIHPADCGCVSLITGLAIIRSLESLGFSELQIKWPNDIYSHGKKLAGVLIEVVSVAHHFVDLVVGIGINVRMPQQFVSKIDQSWIDLAQLEKTKSISRNEIVIAVINQLNLDLSLFEKKGMDAFQKRWRDLDYLHNKEITIKRENGELGGIATGINNKGELLAETGDGLLVVNAGEVSVRASNKC